MARLTKEALQAVLRSNPDIETHDAYNGLKSASNQFEGQIDTQRNRQNKYNAQKCELDGHFFDSLAERARYAELKLMEQAGEIQGLLLQPRYLLQDAFTDKQGRKHQAIEYVGDFKYIDRDGFTICEDVKGVRTPLYRLKAKLAIRKYPHIHFREVDS